MQQLELRPRTWGGRRPGAGRRPSGQKVGVPHRLRPPHHGRHPVHVTLRAQRVLPSLRGEQVFPALRRALGMSSRNAFRIVHFSVQADHVHLMVEAEDRHALSRGLQGLAIRLAKAVNRALERRGAVWGDRYHARALRTPSEVRTALVYVLQNCRKHGCGGDGFDPCSSAAWFGGWTKPLPTPQASPPVVAARTWLVTVGWRRLGLIDPTEAPAPPRGSVRRRAISDGLRSARGSVASP
jgi:putative transposase